MNEQFNLSEEATADSNRKDSDGNEEESAETKERKARGKKFQQTLFRILIDRDPRLVELVGKILDNDGLATYFGTKSKDEIVRLARYNAQDIEDMVHDPKYTPAINMRGYRGYPNDAFLDVAAVFKQAAQEFENA